MKKKKKPIEDLPEIEETFIILDDHWFVSSFDVDLKKVFTYFDDFKEVLEDSMKNLDTRFVIKCSECNKLYTVFTADVRPELRSYCFECDKITNHELQTH